MDRRVDEFERRVEAAHAAKTSAELKALLHDLPGNVNVPAVRGQETLPAEAPIPIGIYPRRRMAC